MVEPVRGHPERVSPLTWAPVKWGSKGNEAKGRGAWCQITSSPMKPEPPTLLVELQIPLAGTASQGW